MEIYIYKDTKPLISNTNPLRPILKKGGLSESRSGVPVEEAEEPSLTRGPTAQSPIRCSSMWKMAGEQGGGVAQRKEEEGGRN